jgi:hypothetical protein
MAVARDAVTRGGIRQRRHARNLAAAPERNIAVISDGIDEATRSFLDTTNGLEAHHPMRFHDVSATVGAVFGVYLAELLVHGYDVARTVGQPGRSDGPMRRSSSKESVGSRSGS